MKTLILLAVLVVSATAVPARVRRGLAKETAFDSSSTGSVDTAAPEVNTETLSEKELFPIGDKGSEELTKLDKKETKKNKDKDEPWQRHPAMPPMMGPGPMGMPPMMGMGGPQGMGMPPMGGPQGMPPMGGQGMGMPPMGGQGMGMPPMGGQQGMGMPPMGGQGMGMPPMRGQQGMGMPPMGSQQGMGMPPMGGQQGMGMPPMGGQQGMGMPPMGGQGHMPRNMQGPMPPYMQRSMSPQMRGPMPPHMQGSMPPHMQGPMPPHMQGPMPPHMQGPMPPVMEGDMPPFMPPHGSTSRPKPGRMSAILLRGPGPRNGGHEDSDIERFLAFDGQIEDLRSAVLNSFYKDLVTFRALSKVYQTKMLAKLALIKEIESRISMPARSDVVLDNTMPSLTDGAPPMEGVAVKQSGPFPAPH